MGHRTKHFQVTIDFDVDESVNVTKGFITGAIKEGIAGILMMEPRYEIKYIKVKTKDNNGKDR